MNVKTTNYYIMMKQKRKDFILELLVFFLNGIFIHTYI